MGTLKQINLGVCLFKLVLLLFGPNFTKGMSIPVGEFIPIYFGGVASSSIIVIFNIVDKTFTLQTLNYFFG